MQILKSHIPHLFHFINKKDNSAKSRYWKKVSSWNNLNKELKKLIK